MCGIWGVAGAPVHEGQARAATASLRHRGPDDEALFRDGADLTLGFARLSILDLSGGRQPLSDPSGRVTVACNGEIYNFRELRRDLEAKGHRFRTGSDAEVLPALYLEHGEDFVTRLRGMFALALWDRDHRRLVLARDALGIKPLFVARREGRLAFASEIKALKPFPWIDLDLDPQAAMHYFSLSYIPSPWTIHRGIRKLAPGTRLVWQDGQVREQRWWELRMGAEEPASEEEAAAWFLERMRESVKLHLLADVPVGVLLSGGLDSSLLTALASEGSARVKTFSIGFDDRRFDELEHARAVSRRYGTDHHEAILRPDPTTLPETVLRGCDEPFGDSSALPTALVSQMAARHVKAVLSGEGGDELLAGYETYRADRVARLYQALPRAATGLLKAAVARLPVTSGKASFDYKARRFVRFAELPPADRHYGWKVLFPPDELAALWHGEEADPQLALTLFRRLHDEAGTDPVNRLLALDAQVYLPDDLLVKVDRMSMAFGLETRVPFLDLPLVEGLSRLSSRWKLRGMRTKHLLRAAAGSLLPKEIMRRPKAGFSVPMADWMRTVLRDRMEEILRPGRIDGGGLLDLGAARRLWDAHLARREDHSRNLWCLLVFQCWRDTLQEVPRCPEALSDAS